MDVTQKNSNNSPNGRETMPNKNGTEDNPNKERVDDENMSNDGGKIDPFDSDDGQNGHDPRNGGPEKTPPPKASRNWTTGDEILGRYQVIELLGQGGMGVVYRCLDLIGKVEVAVKALPPEVSHSTAEMEEVQENYSLVSKLDHTNIAHYKTLEEDEATGDYYLVIEYVEGEDMRRWMKRLRKEGQMSLETALPVLRQVAEALDAAHKKDVIHRDMKPDNVKIMVDGTVKVLDFGLAAQIRTSLVHVSKEDIARAGTNLYKSPEQWRASTRQGASTDQYSLAVTAYEMLSGRVPFESDDMKLLANAVLTMEPERIEEVPKYVNDALIAGLAKEASGRYATCVDFVRALGGEMVKPLNGRKNGTPAKEQKGNGAINSILGALLILILGVLIAVWGGKAYNEYQENKQQKVVEAVQARQKVEPERKELKVAESSQKLEQEYVPQKTEDKRTDREAENAHVERKLGINKEIGYQKVRAEKLGKYIAANFSDKKILVLTSIEYKDGNGNLIPNHLLEGLRKGLGNVSYDLIARPELEEMEWPYKQLANLFEGKDSNGNAMPGYSPVGDFDLLITTIGLPDDTFKGDKAQGKLAGKSIAFVQGFTERWNGLFKNKTIVAAVIDKPYPDESDKAGLEKWEQYPPADMEKAFDVRYILKTY